MTQLSSLSASSLSLILSGAARGLGFLTGLGQQFLSLSVGFVGNQAGFLAGVIEQLAGLTLSAGGGLFSSAGSLITSGSGLLLGANGNFGSFLAGARNSQFRFTLTGVGQVGGLRIGGGAHLICLTLGSSNQLIGSIRGISQGSAGLVFCLRAYFFSFPASICQGGGSLGGSTFGHLRHIRASAG